MHLTERAHQGKDSFAATDLDAAGAPVIKITTKMIQAGARAIDLWAGEDSEMAANSYFKAMVAVMRKPVHKVKAKACL
jgi:hypothetical protein